MCPMPSCMQSGGVAITQWTTSQTHTGAWDSMYRQRLKVSIARDVGHTLSVPLRNRVRGCIVRMSDASLATIWLGIYLCKSSVVVPFPCRAHCRLRMERSRWTCAMPIDMLPRQDSMYMPLRTGDYVCEYLPVLLCSPPALHCSDGTELKFRQQLLGHCRLLLLRLL